MGGRPRTPSKTKELKGTKRKDRINDKEPVPVLGLIKPPAYFDKEQKAIFKEALEYLKGLGVVGVSDAFQLEMFTVTFCKWRETVQNLAESGDSYVSEKKGGGEMERMRPLVQQRNELTRQLNSMMQTMGFSPAARSKLSSDNTDPGKSLDDWLESDVH